VKFPGTRAQVLEAIRAGWNDAADAAGLTALDRKQLFGREVLKEFAFRDSPDDQYR
jgi:hypothetical protein